MSNDLIQKNAELGRFLFCERYTLQPVKNAMYIAEGQDLKRGAVVDVNGVLVGTNSLMPYAVLENDCDTRAKGTFASVFVKGEFNFDKLFFADGLSKEDLDNIVYNGSGIGLVIKPYDYEKCFAPLFSPSMFPAGTSEENPLMNAADTERMILKFASIGTNTLRFEFSKKDYNPIVAEVAVAGNWKKVSTHEANNIWDWTYNQSTIGGLFTGAFNDVENFVSIIAAGTLSWTTFYQTFVNCRSLIYVCDLNAPDVTSLNGAFEGCVGLKAIPNITTSKVTIFHSCFRNCTGLKKIPLIDTQKASNVSLMFDGCVNIEEGALALYTQMSTQVTPPSATTSCFRNCGSNTSTGAAELAQIPESWGGTGA